MEVQAYLGTLEHDLHLDPRKRREVLEELRSHVEERRLEFQSSGLSEQEATDRALKQIGEPQELAKSFYAVHASGSWRDILLAALPHLGLAAVFAFHLWTDLFWGVVAAVGATFIAAVAWRKGSPQWAYPWLGYALALPALTWVLAMAALGYGLWMMLTGGHMPLGAPLYLGIALYIPISTVIMLRIARKAVSHDWLLISLSALPLPFFSAWLFLVHWQGGTLTPDRDRAIQTDADTALVFLALAVTTAFYMKVGRRLWRIGLVLLSTPGLTALYMISYHTKPLSLTTILAIIATIAFLLSPMLLAPSDVSSPRGLQRRPRGRGHGLTPP